MKFFAGAALAIGERRYLAARIALAFALSPETVRSHFQSKETKKSFHILTPDSQK